MSHEPRKLRRLILCLDGTWNREDSSTNVLQHYALVRECKDEPQDLRWPDGTVEKLLVTQIRHYQRGVGTGVLDGVSGGAFGLGLEQNVRDAYNWLLSNYFDADGHTPADDIYMYGFSRGAYTARSLVGFIATCGLLRRGAPLTVEELWQIYGTLGRLKEQRGSSVSNFLGLATSSSRAITDLASDAAPGVLRPEVANDPKRPPTDTERLLAQWSRRVPISYLGIYDTVGAIGIDALAIPGLRGKLAQHNNVRPTSLILRCRHALAVDEHRRAFNHTPFMAYVGDEEEERRLTLQNRWLSAAPAVEGGDAAVSALEMRAHRRWGQRIEQRWFAGAHSNVGGGYPSNSMAQVPLLWIQEGTPELLTEKSIHAPPTAEQLLNLPAPRNSFAEFAAPWSEHFLRSKPNYRVLRPYPSSEPELRAHPKPECQQTGHGFALVSINEVLDPSLDQYWPQAEPTQGKAAREKYRQGKSPNLYLAQKTRAAATGHAEPAAAAPVHKWLGNRLFAHCSALLWAAIAGLGWIGMENLFRTWPQHYQLGSICWIVGGLAAFFVVVDYTESRLNFLIAGGRQTPRLLAMRDVWYWLRAVGVVFAASGALSSAGWLIVRSWNIGCDAMLSCWHSPDVQSGVQLLMFSLGGAGSALLLAALFRPGRAASLKATLTAALIVAVLLPAGAVLMFLVVGQLRDSFGSTELANAFPIWPTTTAQNLAGQLLFVMGTLGLVMNSFSWASAPLARANLGGVRALQQALTPQRFKAQLDFWSQALGPKETRPAEQEAALLNMLRVSMWRDFLGFMPVYFTCFAIGLRFAAQELGWFPALNSAYPHFWLCLPLIVVALDCLENSLWAWHLHQRRKQPSYEHGWALHAPLLVATWLKNLGFLGSMAVVLAATGYAAFGLGAAAESSGWRQGLALLIAMGSIATALYGAWLAIGNRMAARLPVTGNA